MNELNLESLFQAIKPIVDENQNQRREKEFKGEFFNIFSILNMERDEVHTHSAFLAELLNPKGSHGLKDKFLKSFIESISLVNTDISKLNTQTAIVKNEVYIGQKDVENEAGGDIDILISFSNPQYVIIIENKIDAGDQEAQLARYYNYAKQFGNSFTLFYLTKDGHEPSEWSTGTETIKHYWRCISYQEEIFKWLSKCLEISINFALVNSCIKQYKNLILKITGQEINESMNKKILEKMLEHNSEMLAIWENWDKWTLAIAENVIRDVAADTDCKCEGYNDKYPWWIWDRDCWVSFIPNKFPKCKIWFGKEANDSPYYYLEKEDINSAQTKLECMDYESTKTTPFGSKYIDSKYSKWDLSVAQAIQNGELKEYLCQCVKEVLTDSNFPKK